MKIPTFPRMRRILRQAMPSFDPYHRPRTPFPRDPARRKSSYPFISGDTFRSFCDHVFDETKVDFDPSAVERGDCVFVNGSMQRQYFAHAHPHITEPYVLVTHNSVHPAPGPHSVYLEDPKIYAWFAQNADRTHPKLHPIPLGLANAYWEHGDTSIVQELTPMESVQQSYRYLAYLNFSRKRQLEARSEIWTLLKDSGFCHIAENRTFTDYLRDLQSCRFVISPPGNGLDCHRHWEALLVGSVPVMKHSSIDSLFEELPIVLVDDWREVTHDMLLARDQELRTRTFERQRMFAQFWFNRISSAQTATRA